MDPVWGEESSSEDDPLYHSLSDIIRLSEVSNLFLSSPVVDQESADARSLFRRRIARYRPEQLHNFSRELALCWLAVKELKLS